jgi:hypothetical protein
MSDKQHMDRMSELLRTVVWRRRTAFYAEAVRRGIITEKQTEALLLLNLERDDDQDRREA